MSVAEASKQPAMKQKLAAAAARATAACTNTTTLDFAQGNAGESWKNHAPVNAGAANTNTTISTAGTYVEPAGGLETSLKTAVGNNNIQTLYWQADYSSSANATTQIKFSFNRPVNNFTIVIQDIDVGNNAWIDKITLAAQQVDGTVLDMSTAADASVTRDAAYVSLSGNTLTGLQNVATNSASGTASITFNKPITSFQITYQNTIGIPDPANQHIAIEKMTWCTQSNVATTLSGPLRAPAGTRVTYSTTTTTNGDYDASGVQPKVLLTAGLNSQNPVFPRGSNYNNATGVLTLPTLPTLAVGASSTSFISFNMPNSTVTGTASSTINTDDADPLDNNGTLAVAKATTTVDGVPTAAAKSVTAAAGTTVYTALPALTGTDPDNDPLTYTIVGSSIANINFGTVYYTRNGIRTALSGTSNVTLTAAEAATLEFKNTNGTAATPTKSFSYFTSDAYGGNSPEVNYTIGIANQPAVYSSPNIYFQSNLTNGQTLASVTDLDGNITGAVLSPSTPLSNGILFNTTTGAFTARVLTTGPQASRVAALGTYTYTVTTTDAQGGVTTNTVTIRITTAAAYTDAPAVYSTGNIYNRDALTNGSTVATVTDPDAALTAASATAALATGFSLDASTGRITLNSTTVPAAGTYSYTVNTTDQVGGTTAAPVTITLRNDVEAVYTAIQSYNRDALVNNDALAAATDADGSIVSASTTGTLPTGTTLDATTGTFSVSNATTLGALANGTYSFTVNTVDATGGRTASLVGVTLFETEAVYTSAAATNQGYPNGYSLATVADADGAISSAVLNGSTLPAGVGLNTSTGQFTVIDRTLLKTGTYSVQVRTTDATGGITAQAVTINIGPYALPVELKEFVAVAVKNLDAALTWTTASEKNNDHFNVERSFNGSDFAQIAVVKGQGSTTTATNYALTDAGAAQKATGLVYYRLQQVDIDGTAIYSPVRTVAFAAGRTEPAMALVPNPATSATQLDLSALPTGTYQVRVLDATGRVVLSATREAGLTQALELSTIASGTYTVLVRGQHNGQVVNLTKRLIKE